MTNQELEQRQSGLKQPSLGEMSVESLISLRAKINDLLPNVALKDLDLEQELVLQYKTLKNLQEEVLGDDQVPANQRAQVANAVGSNLQALAKMQVDQYSSERFKQIEMALINLLNTWPPDLVAKFFEEYEAL